MIAKVTASVDDLGLVEAIDRFGESVVVGVADTADRWLDTGFRQTLGILIETYWADSSGRRNAS